jgi:hypothetical protein
LMGNNGIGGLPIFITEEAWGGNPTNGAMTDNQKVAYFARDMLLQRMNGISRSYWYAYSNTSWGTLFTAGALTKTGVAYGLLENWLVGSTDLSLSNCSQDGSLTWRCNINYKGNPTIIFWNPANTPSVSFAGIYTKFLTLDNATITPFSGPLTAGLKPQMVISNTPPAPPAPPPLFSLQFLGLRSKVHVFLEELRYRLSEKTTTTAAVSVPCSFC